jgi:hypothetical protein
MLLILTALLPTEKHIRDWHFQTIFQIKVEISWHWVKIEAYGCLNVNPHWILVQIELVWSILCQQRLQVIHFNCPIPLFYWFDVNFCLWEVHVECPYYRTRYISTFLYVHFAKKLLRGSDKCNLMQTGILLKMAQNIKKL